MPLAYLAALYVVYYGPNAVSMLHVRASDFGVEAVEDLSGLACDILLVVFCDLITTCATACLMHHHGIEIFSYLAEELRSYWVQCALTQTWAIATVFCSTLVACFVDLTFQWHWHKP